jgi:hypothetical protein
MPVEMAACAAAGRENGTRNDDHLASSVFAKQTSEAGLCEAVVVSEHLCNGPFLAHEE